MFVWREYLFSAKLIFLNMFEKSNLIYDIGANVGDDITNYLAAGCKVVAVEANPELNRQLRNKFNKAIEDKQLFLLELAVVNTSQKETSFYVTDQKGESSLYAHRLSQAGWGYHAITVSARSLDSIFDEYGRGYYCKMDIEGADLAVLQSLKQTDKLPDYFSVELSGLSLQDLATRRNELLTPLDELTRLGYSKFKLVDQYTLVTLERKAFYKRRGKLFYRAAQKLSSISGLFLKTMNPRKWYSRKYGYRFSMDSSGPFGEMILGSWQSANSMRQIILERFDEYDQLERKNRHYIFWVDLHAAR